MNNKSAQEMLRFQAKRDIINLSKSQLITLEDIRDQYFFSIDKLKKAIPEEYHSVLQVSIFMDDNTFALWRKRTLDASNDSVRHLDEQIQKFNISFFNYE